VRLRVVAALLLLALGPACAGPATSATATPRAPAAGVGVFNQPPTARPAPPATRRPTPSTIMFRAAEVVRVVDGDTLDLRIAGRVDRARLLGINTPESVDPRRPVQCMGEVASATVKEMLPPGTMVHVVEDPSQGRRDSFGRLLLHVWLLDGVHLNEELIRLGLATEYAVGEPHFYQPRFRAAQRAAEEAGRGLWAPGACPTPSPGPSPTRAPTARAAPTPATGELQATTAVQTTTSGARPTATRPASSALAGDCDRSYPDVCIPPPPPDLNCPDVPHRRFRVLPPDPHRLDGDRDGLGCE
jgi:micrococcal nuclease